MRWSFGIQRELPGSVILDTAYVGSSGVKLYVQQDLNPPFPLDWRFLPNGFTSLAQLQAAVSASPNPYSSIRGWTRCRAFGSFEQTMGTLPITRGRHRCRSGLLAASG